MSISIVGDAAGWKRDLFPEGFVPDILKLVINAWKKFSKPNRLDLEVKINKAFTKILRSEKTDLPFKILPEVTVFKENNDNEGRIDIQFSYIGTADEDNYFAFECKRLRIPYPPPQKLSTNNSDYVGDQGMRCFVTGKYSSRVRHGGMIGYVMDGKTDSAIISVTKLINKKRTELKLVSGTSLGISSIMVKHRNVKETKHNLAFSRNFTIYHIFLSV